jgi:hypothetical protein
MKGESKITTHKSQSNRPFKGVTKNICENTYIFVHYCFIFVTNRTHHASRSISAPRWVFDFYKSILFYLLLLSYFTEISCDIEFPDNSKKEELWN